MTCTVVTTTWNSIDHVIPFLKHYRALGIDRMLVMDFASTDGTLDVLTAREWQGFVELAPFPGINGLDSSNLMLSIVKQRSQHDLADGDAQWPDTVGLFRFGEGALVHAQRQLARQRHHPEFWTVLAIEERGERRRPLDDNRLRARVAGKDGVRQRIDVDVRLNEVWKVAPPPPYAAGSHSVGLTSIVMPNGLRAKPSDTRPD